MKAILVYMDNYERYNPNYSKNYTKEDALKAICEDFDICL